MAVDKYPIIWASGGAAEEPTVQRQSTGFTSGPADPSEVNWAIQTLQANHNDLTDLVNSYSIVDDLDIYVPSQYPTIQAAFDFLADKRIAPPAIVRIYLSGEQFVISSELSLDHPNGNRIYLIGQPTLASWPTEASIPSDQATAEQVLRSIFPTVVRCINTRAMSLLNNSIGRIENILFLGDGSVNPGLRLGLRNGQFGRGAAYVQTVWFHGFGSSGVYLELGSQLTGDRLGVSFNGEGIRNARSTIFVTNVRALRNKAQGVVQNAVGNATLHDLISAYNTTHGVENGNGSTMQSERAKFIGNGGYHTTTTVSSSINLVQPNVAGAAGAGSSFYAGFNGYQQIQQPTGSPTYSPAANGSGNNGANTVVV